MIGPFDKDVKRTHKLFFEERNEKDFSFLKDDKMRPLLEESLRIWSELHREDYLDRMKVANRITNSTMPEERNSGASIEEFREAIHKLNSEMLESRKRKRVRRNRGKSSGK